MEPYKKKYQDLLEMVNTTIGRLRHNAIDNFMQLNNARKDRIDELKKESMINREQINGEKEDIERTLKSIEEIKLELSETSEPVEQRLEKSLVAFESSGAMLTQYFQFK